MILITLLTDLIVKANNLIQLCSGGYLIRNISLLSRFWKKKTFIMIASYMSTGILLFFKLELQVKTLFINQSLLRVGPSSFDIICAKCHRLYISLYSTLFLSFLSFQVVKVCILSGDWQLDPSKQRRCGRRIPSCPLSPLQVVFSIL